MNNKTELKACPFCGGKAKITEYQVKVDEFEYTVGCKTCSVAIYTQFIHPKYAIKAWNTRPQPTEEEKKECGDCVILRKNVKYLRERLKTTLEKHGEWNPVTLDKPTQPVQDQPKQESEWKPIELLSEDFDAERILIYTESGDITMRYRIVDYQFAVLCKDATKYIPFY